MGLGSKLRHGWNAFVDDKSAQAQGPFEAVVSYGAMKPDRNRMSVTNERSIVASIYNRLANDVASVAMRHVRLDETDRYLGDIDSGLNNCLKIEANLDQGARAFRQDMAHSLCENGVIALVPVDTTLNPSVTGSYDITTMRVGIIVKWMPRQVRVSVYNDQTGKRQEVTLDKKFVAIVENPFYSVMNEPNSTLQRLLRKLALLDIVDDQSSSGKLDLIIQLPYVIKSDARRKAAEQRRTDIEMQLKGSKYGIAYTDGTEKITQLNRPTENNLLKQVEYLTNLLFSQLGLTPEIMNGTANEATMLNYYARTVEPMLDAVVEAMQRTFLTKTARSQGQAIRYYRDPFKLVPISQVAEIADKFTRNEILTANEVRQGIGFKPSTEQKADELKNSNMPYYENEGQVVQGEVVDDQSAIDPVREAFDGVDNTLDETFKTLGVNESDYL